MKLSKTSCGLEVIWDGHEAGQKLPFDMSSHSCAVWNKRIPQTQDYQQRVMMCSPHDTANDPHNDKVYIDRFCWSTASMDPRSMSWERVATLKHKHIKGAMVQHNGYLTIIGGTGSYAGADSALDTAAVELLEQNLQSNEDGTINRWVPGTWYPIAVEEHAIVSRNSFLYVFGGLNYGEYINDQWEDSAVYNVKAVWRIQDALKGTWQKHNDLLRPRANHNTVFMKDQVYHIAGYAKDYSVSPPVNNGRRVEKWDCLGEDCGTTSNKVESEDRLFNYIAPESFLVKEEWYKTYCG